MTDRERLIELLGLYLPINVPSEVGGYATIGERTLHRGDREILADHLLANGVIVPPCKVGQTVYTRYGYSFKIQRIEILEDKKILFRCGNDGTDDYMAFYDFEIGTDVFLTKKEYEKALAERSENK